jgi:hypothetical protein
VTAGAAAADAVPVYERWGQVPAGLLTQAQLRELEFPRRPVVPVARVRSADFRGRRDRLLVDLYDPEACPPTEATIGQLQAAAARSTQSRRCDDCGAHPERPCLRDVGGRARCPLCQHLDRLRQLQSEAAQRQREAVARAGELLADPAAAVLHVTENVPPRTPAGRIRAALSVRIDAVDPDGRSLVDVTVSRVGERARLRDPAAVPAADVREQVLAALDGKTLLVWTESEITLLGNAVPHPSADTAPFPRSGRGWPSVYAEAPRPRSVVLARLSTNWRGDLTTGGDPRTARHPGTAGRLWLHLTRIAADRPDDGAEIAAAGERATAPT